MNIRRIIRLHNEEKGVVALTPDYFERIAGVLPTRGKLSKFLIEERKKRYGEKMR